MLQDISSASIESRAHQVDARGRTILFLERMKFTILLFIAAALTALRFATLTLPTHAQGPTSTPTRPPSIRSSAAITNTIYLPLIYDGINLDPCAAIPNQSYGSVGIIGSPTDRPADHQADFNLALRGYTPTVAAKNLITHTGPSDLSAPQFANLFTPARLPSFTNTYQVGKWDWGCNCRIGWDDQWEVELLGMATNRSEIISAPASGYDIGLHPTGYEVMVLYATTQRITFTYGRYDSIVDPSGNGYAIHVEDICVEPTLLALYNTLNSQGRSRLPALWANQPFGRARGAEIKVAIRDSGMFMDPRWRLDWWQGY